MTDPRNFYSGHPGFRPPAYNGSYAPTHAYFPPGHPAQVSPFFYGAQAHSHPPMPYGMPYSPYPMTIPPYGYYGSSPYLTNIYPAQAPQPIIAQQAIPTAYHPEQVGHYVDEALELTCEFRGRILSDTSAITGNGQLCYKKGGAIVAHYWGNIKNGIPIPDKTSSIRVSAGHTLQSLGLNQYFPTAPVAAEIAPISATNITVAETNTPIMPSETVKEILVSEASSPTQTSETAECSELVIEKNEQPIQPAEEILDAHQTELQPSPQSPEPEILSSAENTEAILTKLTIAETAQEEVIEENSAHVPEQELSSTDQITTSKVPEPLIEIPQEASTTITTTSVETLSTAPIVKKKKLPKVKLDTDEIPSPATTASAAPLSQLDSRRETILSQIKCLPNARWEAADTSTNIQSRKWTPSHLDTDISSQKIDGLFKSLAEYRCEQYHAFGVMSAASADNDSGRQSIPDGPCFVQFDQGHFAIGCFSLDIETQRLVLQQGCIIQHNRQCMIHVEDVPCFCDDLTAAGQPGHTTLQLDVRHQPRKKEFQRQTEHLITSYQTLFGLLAKDYSSSSKSKRSFFDHARWNRILTKNTELAQCVKILLNDPTQWPVRYHGFISNNAMTADAILWADFPQQGDIPANMTNILTQENYRYEGTFREGIAVKGTVYETLPAADAIRRTVVFNGTFNPKGQLIAAEAILVQEETLESLKAKIPPMRFMIGSDGQQLARLPIRPPDA